MGVSERDECTALLVHDLKNPLMVVKAAFDYVLREMRERGDAEVVEALADGEAAAQRCMELIGGLLDAARLEHGMCELRRERVPVWSLVGEVVAAARVALRNAGLQLEVDVPANVWANLDPGLFRRVLENLLDNAIRNTPYAGLVSVSARRTLGGVELRVADSGPAIPAEMHGRMFEKFGRGRDGKASCGLGLYFCRRVVEAHGGAIGLTSEPGLPVLFWMTVPRPAAVALERIESGAI